MTLRCAPPDSNEAETRLPATRSDNPEAPAVNPGGQDLGSLLVHYVGQSYMNAVNAQQQMYITQQAATTMIITTLLSITTSTIAIAVKNAEAEKASV